jgi:hypothetical protein
MRTPAGTIDLILSTLQLAHLMPTGFGPWADGMALLFLQPTDLLLVIGLALLAVQAGKSCSDRLPLLMPLVWLLGGLIGLTQQAELLLAVPCTALVVAVGVLVTLGVRLQPQVFLPGGAALTFLFSLVTGSALADHPGALAALLGETVAITLLLLLLAQALVAPHPRWLAIALRVVGSWITATGLIMLGWRIRHPQ